MKACWKKLCVSMLALSILSATILTGNARNSESTRKGTGIYPLY